MIQVPNRMSGSSCAGRVCMRCSDNLMCIGLVHSSPTCKGCGVPPGCGSSMDSSEWPPPSKYSAFTTTSSACMGPAAVMARVMGICSPTMANPAPWTCTANRVEKPLGCLLRACVHLPQEPYSNIAAAVADYASCMRNGYGSWQSCGFYCFISK